MFEVTEAGRRDIDALVELQAALFNEDAGQHDPYTDTTWPLREGRRDLETLVASSDALVLAARQSDVIVGLLVGYVAAASPTHQPVTFAVLRTMYVADTARREGVGTRLVEHFLDWARRHGCVEAHVDHYAANAAAAALYERCGFAARSTSRSLPL
jgi:GNAT superfamily N-acetyltransferase